MPITSSVLGRLIMAIAFLAGHRALAESLPHNVTAPDLTNMVLVPAGEFTMGATIEAGDHAPPIHRTSNAFYIDRTEVSNAEYKRFIDESGVSPPAGWTETCPPAGSDSLPVSDVLWEDAMRYAIWAGKRLPTEAEWEKAARGADGRIFPWGNIDDKGRRNLGEHKLFPVGAFPEGASPYGCLNMAGNVWEWTADWYDAYPGSSTPNVHYGQRYKVIRGGGGEYLYGIDNTGATTQRARLLPYGSHDFVGFRCVADPPGVEPPYDPQKLLAEANAQLTGRLKAPKELSYEREFEKLLEQRRISITVDGKPGQTGYVRIGVPFPEGLLKEASGCAFEDGRDLQMTATVRWPDGSIRWALLDFAARAGEVLSLQIGRAAGKRSANTPRLSVTQDVKSTAITTSKMALRFDESLNVTLAASKDAGPLLTGMALQLKVQDDNGETMWTARADSATIENQPIAGGVRVEGTFFTEDGNPAPFRFDMQAQARADSTRANLLVTLVHQAARREPLDTPAPVVVVKDAVLSFEAAAPFEQATFGLDGGRTTLPVSSTISLSQPDDLQFTISNGQEVTAHGTRAAGWVAGTGANGDILLGVRHFWQNHPKSLFITPDRIGVHLWSGKHPFEWEAGLAKTHEIILDVSPLTDTVHLDPLRGSAPPAWVAGSKAMGEFMPRCVETMERFAYWELLRTHSMKQWVRAMPFGFRDFGDAYMGGPYKGKNAFNNLEYDVHWNFMRMYLRSGDTWYLNMAEVMARHQADIDTDHFHGWAWKHSPQHTTTRADFGHVFIKGLILHYLLTGEKRSIEAATKVADWVAAELEKGHGVGNERQIGWSLYALTALYDITGDPKHLHACETLCRRLIQGQSPTGKFDIRWDNRISFFNGIAMNGMLSTYELNHDKSIAEAVLRVANRTLGFYPEYACRTLNAFCWAAKETDDPRYLDVIDNTWRTSMAWLMDRDAAGVVEATHAWRFSRVGAQHGLVPLFDETPTRLPEPKTWRGLRLEVETVECFIRNPAEEAAPLLIIREGATQGKAELFDATGTRVEQKDLHHDGDYLEPTVFELPPGSLHRLRLSARGNRAWEVHYDGGTQVTLADPDAQAVLSLAPRAYGFITNGAKHVTITFEAIGEGFHMATLYDPQGNPAATVRHFIDFEDPNRYELKLEASVQGDTKGWSLELHGVKILDVNGLSPYWSENPEELFHPERLLTKTPTP